jgi:hypothetical protein
MATRVRALLALLGNSEVAYCYARAMRFDPGSRSILSRHDLARFPAATLFDKLARIVCEVDCLPRKELYESWEVARRIRRRFRGGRVVDLACGHGLTGWVMLILDGSSEQCVGIDRRVPASARRLHDALAQAWPALARRVSVRESDLADELLHTRDLVLATHACGSLTDRVLARASEARARVAVLPCCHDASASRQTGLSGWLDPALAIDVARASQLAHAGYRVHTQTIPAAITPQNRLLMGEPI